MTASIFVNGMALHVMMSIPIMSLSWIYLVVTGKLHWAKALEIWDRSSLLTYVRTILGYVVCLYPDYFNVDIRISCLFFLFQIIYASYVLHRAQFQQRWETCQILNGLIFQIMSSYLGQYPTVDFRDRSSILIYATTILGYGVCLYPNWFNVYFPYLMFVFSISKYLCIQFAIQGELWF